MAEPMRRTLIADTTADGVVMAIIMIDQIFRELLTVKTSEVDETIRPSGAQEVHVVMAYLNQRYNAPSF